ncbi:uncharacterized protein T069G_10548 [Trichoderma breve]|uniref:DUF7730 domain-containing protein n=1 Tax=Trichoderma breve TaxID=2034170 RepID=A0A9W9E2Y7_9HYPO|nr:uncharacterized protein T069G_10548 [Trichoderma breve]KAJ4854990.1 hypothetical protein T069G_10548 [Trichoderma breve]
MPNAIISWFRRRRVARSSKKQRGAVSLSTRLLIEAPPIPPHPTLPSQRRGRLTPAPSHESLIAASNAATANSSFFTKLPVEIRRKILIEAFGGQTIHMDLIYNHPPQPPEEQTEEMIKKNGRFRAHGNFNVNVHGVPTCDERNLRLDDSQPKRWAWRSSVCHRNGPARCRPEDEVQPGEDYCRFGQSPWHAICLCWPGEFPTKCQVGAMGWLCSCRQAYLEGIDVLYSTNTIHTASKEMILSLTSILLPQRLSSITSVELLWDFAPFPSIHPEVVKPPLSDMASFRAFLDAIPTTFPALRKVHISLQGHIYPTKTINGSTSWDNNIDRVDEILHPVDYFVLGLEPDVRRSFSLGIPSSLYRSQRDRALQNNDPVEQAHRGQYERHWRPLKGTGDGEGYWVCLGNKDLTMPFICTMGEGGYESIIGKDNWVFYSF